MAPILFSFDVMFYLSKKDGISYNEWEKAWKALNERFSGNDIAIHTPDLFRFNLSPVQAFKICNYLDVNIRKNQKRIYSMQGFSHRFSNVVEELGANQLELSNLLDLTQPQIHHYLKGKSTPRPIMRQKIAYYLKVDYLWLSWGMGEKKVYKQMNYPINQLHITFGERLTYFMMIKNLGVQELSNSLNVSGSAVQYWQEGKRTPRRHMFARIAKVIEADTEWLRYGTREIRQLNKSIKK